MKKVQTAKLIVYGKRLWKEYIKKHTKALLLVALFMVLSSAATSAQPLLIQQAFDKIFKAKDMTALMVIPGLIIILFSLQAIALYMSNMMMSKIMNLLIADMRKVMFRHILENEVDFYSENDSGTLLSRIVNEITFISAAVNNFFNAWGRQLITSIGLLAVMIHQSLELTLIAFVGFAFAGVPLKRITVRLKKLHRQVNDTSAMLNRRLIESLTGIRTVKAFRKESFEADKIDAHIDEVEQFASKTYRVALITSPLMQVIAGISVAFVIWYGGSAVIDGRMTEGNLIAFISSLIMFTRPVRAITNSGGVMVKGLVAAERFFEIVDAKPRYISRAHGTPLAIDKADIVFENVGFTYANGMEAVRDVSVRFEAGKRTALVGHSGSGKSTIFSLLMKFYDPTTGRILIDGQDMMHTSVDSVRQNIALVSQDIFIFDESAMKNIGYGRDGASEEEIIAAAKAANCHDFIMQLPDGYQTKLGFSGQSLSGGQKQRIAIARAFLRDAPILLMDEATSALDPRTEAEIQAAIDILCKGRTTIIIAHRLSTVMHADRMILMDSGKVAEVGTHQELAETSELYQNHFGLA